MRFLWADGHETDADIPGDCGKKTTAVLNDVANCGRHLSAKQVLR